MSPQVASKLKLNAIIGMSVEEAKEYLARIGFKLRPMSVDGECLMGTCEINSKRVNVSVVDDRIDEITSIG